MKTLNILNDFELKQIFGPLEDILPLHEGKILFKKDIKYSHQVQELLDPGCLLYRSSIKVTIVSIIV
jgi:hypothetical protein